MQGMVVIIPLIARIQVEYPGLRNAHVNNILNEDQIHFEL